MDQGTKGMGLFFAGWILALATYYLGPLDTGFWVPLVVIGAELVGYSLMLIGTRKISDQHRNYKRAQIVSVLALVVSLGLGILQALALEGITSWMAIIAICLAPTGDILFMILTGLILLGICDRLNLEGKEHEANRLSYLWAIFLTFAILYLVIQTVAVLLVNEGLSALTYIVPATGVPLLAIGMVLIIRIYRIHELPVEATK